MNEYTLICRYFTRIIIDYNKKSKNRIIKAYNIQSEKVTYPYNFYEMIFFTNQHEVTIIGDIKGTPYQRTYEYINIDHLEFLINITYIQNCLYHLQNKHTTFKLKEKK